MIAGGLCIIPSLYAWFNIYSNWDPYANTSSLKVAVVSEDSGFSSKGSDPVNMGNQVVEQLHDNTGVGWVFPQDTDAALKGVYDGSYYAAIIIGDDFSRSLFDFLDNGMNHPSVTYYENSKKNAVATKITDTASSTLQQTINTEFINVAAQTALSGLESITQKDSSISGKLIDDMKTIQDNLSGYADTIATFQNGNASLSENLESMSALIPELQDILENSKDTTKLTQSALSRSVDNMTDQLDTTLAAMETISEQVQKHLDTAQNKITSDTQGASDALSAALDGLNSLLEQNHKLDDLLNKLDDLEYIDHNIIAQIRGQLEAISTLQDLAKNLIDQTSSIVKETPEIAAMEGYQSGAEEINRYCEAYVNQNGFAVPEGKESFAHWLADQYGDPYRKDMTERLQAGLEEEDFYEATGESLIVLADRYLGRTDQAENQIYYREGAKEGRAVLSFAGDLCLAEEGFVLDHYNDSEGLSSRISPEILERTRAAAQPAIFQSLS